MGRLVVLLLVVALIVLGVTATQAQDDVEANKAVAETFITEILPGDGDVSLMDGLYTEDFVFHFMMGQDMDFEAYQEFWTGNHASLPDLHVTDYVIIGEGDLVAAWWYMGATFANEWAGIPPTGEEFGINVFALWRFEDGQIAEAWDMVHTMDFMQQLGAVPSVRPVGPQEPWEIVFAESELSPEKQVRLLKQHWAAVATEGPAAYAVFTEDAVHHSALSGDVDLQGLQDANAAMDAALEGLAAEGMIVAEGNLVMTFRQFEGVFANELEVVPVPPNNNLVQWNSAHIYRFEEGLIAESWVMFDTLSFITQLRADPIT